MKQKFKILMLLDAPFPTDERVRKEAISLIADGHEVHIGCMKNMDAEKNMEVLYGGIKIIRFNISAGIKKKLEPFLPLFRIYQKIWYHKIERYIRVAQINVLHCHDLPMASVGYYMKAKMPHIKLVMDLHENYPSLVGMKNYMRSGWFQYIVSQKSWYNGEKKWLSRADLVIVTASGMKTRLENSNIPIKNFCLLENTIDLKTIAPFKSYTDKSKMVIVYTGGITYHRGLHIALSAFHKLSKKIDNLEFWIVGSGAYEKELKKLCENLGIPKVKWFGWQSKNKMYQLISKGNVTIIPHLKYEHTNNTSPNKLFEYWFFKKPVLCSNCDYLEELIALTKGGLVYQHDSIEDCAKKMELIITNSKNMGINGHQYVLKKANWDYSSKSLLMAYQDL